MGGTAPAIIKRPRKKRKLYVEGNRVVFRKRLVHSFELPPEIAEWVKKNEGVIDWLVYDTPLRTYLRHPHSVRTLVLLLYARANDIPIAQFSRRIGVSHEQLYRLERLLNKLELKEFVYSLLKPSK